MDALKLDTVRLAADRSCLEILDQTLLPGTVKVLRIEKIEDIFEAIRFLRVRGAPAIGVCAAYGIALTASRIGTQDYETFLADFREQKKFLASSRPTAVNLFWALDRMERTLLSQAGKTVEEIKEVLFREAQAIRDEDVAISRSIGEIGFGLLKPGDGILTHCNAGTLATAKYGTATAPMYVALDRKSVV